MAQPIVSVVIPTRGRPKLVVRAVETALCQTFRDLEVIVVLDGSDPQTQQALRAMDDPRLRILPLDQPKGGSEARNAGVRHAAGSWIAFLDDDDEWLPEKIAKQMAVALASDAPYPVVTTRLIARKDAGETIWPRRTPRNGEPISEYLFCRSSIQQGEGFIQTSTILARRDFLTQAPFNPGLPKHQDWDWLIRASQVEGVRFEWVWEPLSIFNLDTGRTSVGRSANWSDSLTWAETNGLLTGRAFSAFVAIQIAPRIRLLRDWKQLPRLLLALLRCGSIDWHAIYIGLAFLLVPSNLRAWIVNRRLSRNASVRKVESPVLDNVICRIEE